MTIKNILLLRRARKLHISAHELGAKLTVVMEQKQLIGADLSIYERTIGIKDGAKLQEWIEAAKFACSLTEITHLGVFSEPAEYIGVEVAKALGLSYLSFDQINNTHDKVAMRQQLRDSGVDQTFSYIVTPPFADNLANILKQKQCPLIVKPRDARASVGVSLIKTVEDIEHALDWLNASGNYDSFIAEQFLSGPEYSVEAFSAQGKHHIVAITEKLKDLEHFVELGHTIPAPLSVDQQILIQSYIRSVLTALGITEGPTHTEIIITDSGPKIVETHIRVGGDEIDSLVKSTTGVDLNQLWVQHVLNPELPFDPQSINDTGVVSGIRFLVPKTTGRVKAVHGIEEVKKIPGVQRVTKLIDVGELISSLTDSNSRLLFVEAQADSHQTLAEVFEQAFVLLEYEVE